MSIANIMAKEPFFLGDYVLDDYGRRGRVVAIHNGCPADTAWLAGQQRPFSQEEIDQRHEVDGEVHYWRWLSVLTEGGGSIWTTEKRVARIAPFPLNNDYDHYYFPPTRRSDDVERQIGF